MDSLPKVFATGVGILVVVVATVILLGCSGRVHDRPVQEASDWMAEGRWCIIGDRASERMVVCFETVDRCLFWQRQARRRGKMVNVRSASACQHVAGVGR